MKIADFHIRNFRSLREIHMDNLSDLNVLIGKNSSGKSNILEGLTFLFDNFSPTGGSTPGLNEFLWHNKQVQDPISFSVEISLEDGDVMQMLPRELLDAMGVIKEDARTLSFSRKVNAQGIWSTDYLRLGKLPLVLEDKALPMEEFAKALPQKDATPSQPESVPSLTPELVNAMLSRIEEKVRGRFRLISAVRDVKNPVVPQRMALVDSQLQNQLWNWDQSNADAEQDKYVSIETAFADVTKLKLDMAAGQVYVKKPKRIPIASEGGGVQALLNIIFSLSSDGEKDFIFAIEEPESHSHFEYQKQFFQIIRRFAKNNQIFVSTHSPVFVDKADPRNTWIVRLEENGTGVERLAELREVLDEIGARPSDLFFFANRILLVEGESDEIIIRAFAKLMGKDLTDVLIVPVKGKNGARLHLGTWVGITRGTIPMYMILEADAAPEAEQLVKENKIDRSAYHVWKLGAIEEYYPTGILRDALQGLEERYNADIDPNKIMKQIEKGEIKASQINIGDKERNLGRPWKVVLAEQVAELLPKAKTDLQDEVSMVLEQAVP